MILNNSRPPKVRMPGGTVKSLEECGLPQLLAAAAQAEGYTDWWVAEDLLVGVRTYLVQHRSEELLEAGELESMLLRALVAIGHPDIARRIGTSVREARICLAELAQKAGTGYELAFFNLLQGAVDTVVQSRSSAAHFAQLRGAVQTLLGATRWSPACERLKNEIIQQIDLRVASSGQPLKLALTLS